MNEVEAVKTKEEIKLVEQLLAKHHGSLYADLWRTGANLALRISDLLSIKLEDIDLNSRELELVEGKTGKKRHLKINETALSIITKRLSEYPEDIYLFQVHSNRTKGMAAKPVSRVSVARVFKEVGEIVCVKLGTHSMRKSRGWAMYSDGVPVEMICKVLNQSSPAVTMRYLGITKAEVMQTYLDYEL